MSTRRYGDYYSESLSGSINDVIDSVDRTSYKTSIMSTSVGSNRSGLKYACLSAADDALARYNEILENLETLRSTLESFYSEADETAGTINQLAIAITNEVETVNTTLQNLTSMLSAGQYNGSNITAEMITDACQPIHDGSIDTRFHLVEEGVFNGDGSLNEEAATDYINELKNKVDNGIELSEEELADLNELYNFYCKTGYGPTGDIRDLPDSYIDNCISVYEMINPEAKSTTTEFFYDLNSEGDPIAIRNANRIKYAIYTADPEYRDIILYYLDDIALIHDFKGPGPQNYNPYTNILSVDLTIDYDELNSDGTYKYGNPFGAFFHELGHGIDDLSTPWGNNSEQLAASLRSDLRNSIDNYIKSLGLGLTEEERNEIIDFIMSGENINVVPEGGDINDISSLIGDRNWSDKQIEAFTTVREYYGCNIYTYDPSLDPPVRVDRIGPSEEFQYSSEYGIYTDITGGLTNNQIGGYWWNHGPDFSNANISSQQDLYDYVQNYTYWYNAEFWGTRTSTNKPECEFFAENFEYNMINRDLEPTRRVYGNSCDEYNDIIDDIYEDIQ